MTQYADYLFGYALARVRKAEVAEDLVQDTFFSALRALDTFEARATEKTWLTAILKRKIIDYYRKKSTQNERSVLDKEGDGSFIDHFFNGDGNAGHWTNTAAPTAWGKDFETSVESEQFYAILQQCLNKLPEKWSAAFTLRNMDDLDAEAICKELGITPSNYWVIMHRAKLQLRECLETNWFNS
ncbi:MAG: sigma-70 family RNA polymerase sigma factor [Chitinophagales bacterium]